MARLLACLPLLLVSSPCFAEHWIQAVHVSDGPSTGRVYADADSLPAGGKGLLKTKVVFDNPTLVRQGVRATRVLSTFEVDCTRLRGSHRESLFYGADGTLVLRVSGNEQGRFVPPPDAVLDVCSWKK
jgi:hypothetical protein